MSVYDTGEDVGAEGTVQPYIVMEFVQGRTLRDILKAEGRLPPRRAMEIIADVSAALDFSHRAGLVHRDVKPANVMITQAGAVKVMDFGIARAVADNSATVTQTANVIGTAQYLSPEQARGEAVDARSDVYSTGCLLYELVTGVPPFQGDSPVAVAYQHVREAATAPSSRVPGLPPALDSIVMKALAKNPQNRYQSAGEMRSDLQRALANQPVSAESVMTDAERTQFIARTPPPPVVLPRRDEPLDEPERDRRNAVIWVSIVVALLLVVGAGAFFIWKLGNSNKPTPQVTVPPLVGLSSAAANKKLHNPAELRYRPTPARCTCSPSPDSPTTPGPCDDGSTPKQGRRHLQAAAGQRHRQREHQVDEGSTVLYELYKKATVARAVRDRLYLRRGGEDLANANLKIKQGKPINTFDTPQGAVVTQKPKNNVTVSPSSTVIVHLSTGKGKLPDVTGMKSDVAKTKLNQLGFTSVDNTTSKRKTADTPRTGWSRRWTRRPRSPTPRTRRSR